MTPSVSMSEFDKHKDALTVVANRVTSRDRWLLSLLFEHQVLTTEQITALAFPSEHASRHRLVHLQRMGVLDRFRPISREARASYHYMIGPVGVQLLAAERSIDPKELRYDRNRIRAMSESPLLHHRIGVNSFFAQLSTIHRLRPNLRLDDWWSERQCTREWGRDVQPDGYGVLVVAKHRLPFFLEYDRGTETTERVVAKLNAYRAFSFGTVLFWFLTPARERNFLRRARGHSTPFAVANSSLGDVTDSVWMTPDDATIRKQIEDVFASDATCVNESS